MRLYKEVMETLVALDRPEGAKLIEQMIADAVEAEREACAQIADRDAEVAGSQNLHEDAKIGRTIAIAIRARGESHPKRGTAVYSEESPVLDSLPQRIDGDREREP